MRVPTVCAILAFVMVVPLPSLAQQQTPSPPRDLSELSFQELIDLEVVYAASKSEQKPREAPSSVTIVSREQILAFGYRSLAEILHGVRGFVATSDRNYSYLGVRGFARPGDYNSRILLLVNGTRVNENIYGSVLAGRENLISVDMIERVEIVRGPSSSIYGTNAFFGVVNIITRVLPATAPVEVVAEGGSHESFGAGSAAGHEFASGGRLDAMVAFYDSAGPELYFPEYDAPESNDGVTKNDDERAWNVFGALRSGGFLLQAAAVDREKGIPTGAFGTVFDDERNRTDDALGFASLQWDGNAGGAALQARVSLGRYAYDGTYVLDYPPVTINRDESRGSWANGEFMTTIHPTASQTLIIGTEFQQNFEQRQRNFDVDPHESYLDVDDTPYRWAAYVQDEFRMSSKIRAVLGLRYDYDEDFGGEASPRAALVAALDPETTLKLLGGYAFRAPNAFELLYETQSPLQYPNPELEPESLESYEIILERLVGVNGQVTASLFRNDLSDLIELVQADDGALQYRNVGGARATGGEIELSGKWGRVRAIASFAYQDVVNTETDDELSNAPNHLVKSQISFPAVRGSSLGLETLYTGPRSTLSGGDVGGHTVVNATLRIPFAGGRSEVIASTYNALDRDWADPSLEEHLQESIARDGRTFRIQVRYALGR